MKTSVLVLLVVPFCLSWLENVCCERIWPGFTHFIEVRAVEPRFQRSSETPEPSKSQDGSPSPIFKALFNLKPNGVHTKKDGDSSHGRTMDSDKTKISLDTTAIKSAITDLTEEDFKEDAILVLEKGEKGVQIFRHPPEVKGGSVVFTRMPEEGGDKEDEAVIVLKRTQDHMRIARTKRTYVVLRRTSDKDNHYYVLYAYIKRINEESPRNVEWDTWDARGGLDNMSPFGWTNCKRSNFVSCRTSEKAENPAVSKNHANSPEYPDLEDLTKYPLELGDTDTESESFEESEESVEEIEDKDNARLKRESEMSLGKKIPYVQSAAKILERTMTDAKFDYYADLRDDKVQAKLIGVTTDLLTKSTYALTIFDKYAKLSHTGAGVAGEDEKVPEEGDAQVQKAILEEVEPTVNDAIGASIRNSAGLLAVIGLLVGGVDQLVKNENNPNLVGEREFNLGKKFLQNIVTKLSNDSNALLVNPNPANFFDNYAMLDMFRKNRNSIMPLIPSATVQTGRALLGLVPTGRSTTRKGGVVKNLQSLLVGEEPKKQGKEPTEKSIKEQIKKKKQAQEKALQKKLQGEGISQKALATALMKAAKADKEEMLSRLPDGYAVSEEKEKPVKDGMALGEMAAGSLAMLETGDMVHKLVDGGYVLLPKEGGMIYMTAKEISEQYGTAVVPKIEPAKAERREGLIGGLLGGVGKVVSGLLNNVGNVVQGGSIDKKTGKRKGVVEGVGTLLTDLVGGVDKTLNGEEVEDEETEVLTEYVDVEHKKGHAKPKASGRAFDIGETNPTTASPSPNSPPDCVTRRPGKKTWYDPLGLYPDPEDPCYFAPVALSPYQAVAPVVPIYEPYGYTYPFYPYFGRKKRSIPKEFVERPVPLLKRSVADSVEAVQGLQSVKPGEGPQLIRQERGWLFGNGRQNGNGCMGVAGFIGSFLGNRRGCEKNDTLTIVQPGLVLGPPAQPIISLGGQYPPGYAGPPPLETSNYPPPPPVPEGSSYPPPPPVDSSSYPPPPPVDSSSYPPPPPVDSSSYPPPPPVDSSSYPPPPPVASYPPPPPVASYPPPPPVSSYPPPPPVGGSGAGLSLNLGGYGSLSIGGGGPPPPPTQPAPWDTGRRRRSVTTSSKELNDEQPKVEVKVPVTRSEILAQIATQVSHDIAATSVAADEPPPVSLPGKSPTSGSDLIEQGLAIFEARHQSVNEDDETGFGFEMEVDMFSHIGWLTQDHITGDFSQALIARKHQVFTGLGTCPHSTMNLDDVKSDEEAVVFYLNALRTGCHPQAKEKLLQVISEGCIKSKTIKGKMAFEISYECTYLSKPKLSNEESELLSKAFEIVGFSQAYIAESDNDKSYKDGIATSVRTLKDMTILIFKKAKDTLHFIKITRNVVKTLKSAFAKGFQDLVRYNSCAECTKDDQETAYADVKTLLGVIEYITADCDPYRVNWKTYHNHFINKATKIDKLIKAYYI